MPSIAKLALARVCVQPIQNGGDSYVNYPILVFRQ
jgi:hypothetical protein